MPQYAKHRVEQDANTYAHLSAVYLKLRELDKVIELYDKSQEKGLKPTYKLISQYLEAALRKEDSELIYKGLSKFADIGLTPHHRVLKRLGDLKHVPDNIYVILKTKFPQYGNIKLAVR